MPASLDPVPLLPLELVDPLLDPEPLEAPLELPLEPEPEAPPELLVPEEVPPSVPPPLDPFPLPELPPSFPAAEVGDEPPQPAASAIPRIPRPRTLRIARTVITRGDAAQRKRARDATNTDCSTGRVSFQQASTRLHSIRRRKSHAAVVNVTSAIRKSGTVFVATSGNVIPLRNTPRVTTRK